MSDQTQDVGEMEAGPTMDERVCKALGIPGRVEYYARAPGREGVGWYFADRRSEVEEVVERYTREYPNGWQAGSTVEEVTCYPRVSEVIAAAWRVVERMRERWAGEPNALRGEPNTWEFHDFADEGWRASVIWLHHDGPVVEVDEIAPTLPLAICRAALADLSTRDA